MTVAAAELAREHRLAMSDLDGIVVHGGNGRMPALVARRLGLPAARVWSRTSEIGNLGSVSLPAAWVGQAPAPKGPVIWTAAGAGLMSAAALTGTRRAK